MTNVPKYLSYRLFPNEGDGPKTSKIVNRYIVCAANLTADNKIILGVRHHDPIMRATRNSQASICKGIEKQGFIDQWGTWVSRDEALFIVKETGQHLKRPWDEYDTLYSENLY